MVAVQVSVLGLYLAPVLSSPPWKKLAPPHTIISLPVHTAAWLYRAVGALIVLIAVQLSITGLYLPPVFNVLPLFPPQTIISAPVHTAVCSDRASGAFTVLVGVQVSVLGLYLPPVLVPKAPPPQMIISLPVQ